MALNTKCWWLLLISLPLKRSPFRVCVCCYLFYLLSLAIAIVTHTYT
jgi:hypothetical protein